MITYKDLDGEQGTGEIWSPGPVNNSIWVLLKDGSAVVVHATKKTQIVYQPMTLPNATPVNVDIAASITRMYWHNNPDEYAHMSKYMPPMPSDFPVVTKEQYLWAQDVIHYAYCHSIARQQYLSAHRGRVALSDKRFKEMTKS